jgi:hypothetical protein
MKRRIGAETPRREECEEEKTNYPGSELLGAGVQAQDRAGVLLQMPAMLQ